LLSSHIIDERVVRETRRCAGMWRSLQELGGIHNSHAARLLAQERKKWAEQLGRGAEPDANRKPPDPTADSAPAPAIAPESARGPDVLIEFVLATTGQ